MYNAVWLVDAWDQSGTRIIEQVAYCKCFAAAEAAYGAAIKAYPYGRVTLRHGMRLINEHRGKFDPKRAAGAP